VPAMDRVEENMRRQPEQAVVDARLTNREGIVDMDQREVDLIASIAEFHAQATVQLQRRGVDAALLPEAFTYRPESNTCQCPGGKVLRYEAKESLAQSHDGGPLGLPDLQHSTVDPARRSREAVLATW